MNEKELQDEVVQLATKLNWSHYHTYRSEKSDKGFPDLVLVNPNKGGRVIYAEIKSDTGRVTQEQEVWLDMLAMCDQEVYVFYPKHLDEILGILLLGHKPSVAVRLELDSAVVYCENSIK